MNDSLKKWCEVNYIRLHQQSDLVFYIDNFGKFLLIKSKSGKLLTKGLKFIIDDEDLTNIDENEPDYLLFEFG